MPKNVVGANLAYFVETKEKNIHWKIGAEQELRFGERLSFSGMALL